MCRMIRRFVALPALLLVVSSPAIGADPLGLEPQPISLQAAGPLAFGPHSTLFVGDPKAATVYAINSKDAVGSQSAASASDWVSAKVDDLRVSLAMAAGSGAAAEDVQLVDLAVDPESGNVIASAKVGDRAMLFSLSASGDAKALSLDKVMASKVALPDPPADKVSGEGRRAANRRMESITDLAFAEGRVLVSGLTGQEGASTVLAFDFPFRDKSVGTDLEIYHGAHGRVEETAAVRSFVPMTIDGKPSLLAGFTCTPLVQFSLADLQSGNKVRGKTVAELGNRNKPLDMVPYEKDGHPYLLVANSARGLMKVDVANIAAQEAINKPVPGGGTEGLSFVTVDSLQGVTQLAKLDETHCLVVSELPSKQLRLTAVELP
ncbi:MAG: hypothetical protein ACO1RT_02370 [Planctomycetaceae bacterium]